jgi:molybdopterin converting factor small subunit
MVTVTVRLYSILRHRDGRTVDELVLDLADGSTVAEVLAQLEIEARRDLLISVKQEPADPDIRLADGDVITMIPLISSGSMINSIMT